MAEYIDRKKAIKAIESLPNCYNGFSDTYDKACIIGVLEELPTAADVVERKHGKWIENKEESEKHIEPIFICSACENMEAWGYIEKNTYNFCPHCGADMSESEDEDD